MSLTKNPDNSSAGQAEGCDHIGIWSQLAGYKDWAAFWTKIQGTEKNGRLRANGFILFHGDKTGARGALNGDAFDIPAPEQKQVGGTTDAHHPNNTGTPKVRLRLRILNEDLKPLANASYQLHVDGILVSLDNAQLTAQGMLDVAVPPTAQGGVLEVTLPPDAPPANPPQSASASESQGASPPPPVTLTFQLSIGRLDPIQEQAPDDKCVSGVQQRLNNLGFDAGPINGILGGKNSATRAAIGRFQRKFNITGEQDTDGPLPGPLTQQKLFDLHDRPGSAQAATTVPRGALGTAVAPPPSSAPPDNAQSVTPASRPLPPLPRKRSGRDWVAWANSFAKDSKSLDDLQPAFKTKAQRFIRVLQTGRATVDVLVTKRNTQRAYLEHWAWKVLTGTPAASVPAREDVPIDWAHPTDPESQQAARDMCAGFGLTAEPELSGKTTNGLAIKLGIRWTGTLNLVAPNGADSHITANPGNGGNAALHREGRDFGLEKRPRDDYWWLDHP